jgi:hypothetical protein
LRSYPFRARFRGRFLTRSTLLRARYDLMAPAMHASQLSYNPAFLPCRRSLPCRAHTRPRPPAAARPAPAVPAEAAVVASLAVPVAAVAHAAAAATAVGVVRAVVAVVAVAVVAEACRLPLLALARRSGATRT